MDFKLTKWRVENIDFSLLDKAKVYDNKELFYLVTAASFVEITSGLYTKNLVSKYSSQSDTLAQWLSSVWEFEEIQHGRALRDYVKSCWSEFDWDAAYKGFFEEYSKLCTESVLKNSPALEMIERAVIETGTSTFYTFLGEITDEPILQELAQNIKNDEVSHYKVFKDCFEEFDKNENNSKWDIFKTVIERIKEIENDDTYIAFKYIYAIKEGKEFEEVEFEKYAEVVTKLMEKHYPYKMGSKMILQLFDFGDSSMRLILPVMIYLAKKFLFK